MFKTLAVVIAAMCVSAPAAGAVTLTSPSTGRPMGGIWTKWIDEMKVPTVNENVIVHLEHGASLVADCQAGADGCSIPGEIWLSDRTSPYEQRQDLYHELGHEADFANWDLSWFEPLWGLAGGWTTPFKPAGVADPMEWFAEAYRVCADFVTSTRHDPPLWDGNVGYDVDSTDAYGFPGYRRQATMVATCRAIDAS